GLLNIIRAVRRRAEYFELRPQYTAVPGIEVRHQLGLGGLALLHDGEDGEVLEEVAGHLVQLRLGRRRDHHAEVQGVALELGLDGEALLLLDRVPRDKYLLGRLQNVRVLRREVTARRVHRGRTGQTQGERCRQGRPQHPTVWGFAHDAILSH